MLAPPDTLLDLLARLGLALPAQVLAMRPRVRRLTRDLPAFEMVWVDALAQARLLTPFQAAEINAGRGESLAVGPFVLEQPLESLGYADVFRARDARTRQTARLTIAKIDPARTPTIEAELKALVRRAGGLIAPPLAPIEEFGLVGDRMWAAGRHVVGQSAAEWLVRHGRLAPPAVLEIARQMLAGLATLEQAGVTHGGLHARTLVLTSSEGAFLPAPGLRGIVRPSESYANANVLPEVLDSIAPERIADGSPPSLSSDTYACGTLWWQLLAGRAPIAGATGLAKLRNVQMARIPDISQIAPDTPRPLVEAIRACLQHEATRRPKSFAELAAQLTPATAAPRKALSHAVRHVSRRAMHLGQAERLGWWQRAVPGLLIATGCALVLAIVTWPKWGPRTTAAVSRQFFSPQAPGTFTPPLATRLLAPLGTSEIKLTAATVELPVATSAPRAGSAPGSVLEPNPARGVDDLVLPANVSVPAEAIRVSAGQLVRGRPGERPQIVVSRVGLAIDVENVRFMNVDFVASPGQTATATPVEARALLRLHANRAEFDGCSWTGNAANPSVAALAWVNSPAAADSPRELVLRNCLFQRVAAGLHREDTGQCSIEANHVLHLGPGPFVALDRPPGADQPVALSLSRVTLREASGLLACSCGPQALMPGRLAISAVDCAFAPASSNGLLLFTGDESPAPILAELSWTGQGSVLTRQSPLAVWRGVDGQLRAATDNGLQVDGLVHSGLDFAGPKDAGPAASRIVRWQAPLRSTQPPGIRDDAPLLTGAAASKP